MKGRTLLGALAAAVVMFLWGFVSHMFLGLGDFGVKEIPNEAAVLAAINSNVQGQGFYYYPGMGKPQNEVTEADQKLWEEKYRAGGHGVLIYTPAGKAFSFPAALGTQFLTALVASLVAAFLLSNALGSLAGFLGRTLFVGALGLFSSFDILIPYWNWYDFPANYVLGSAADRVIGWTLAGAVLAFILKPKA